MSDNEGGFVIEDKELAASLTEMLKTREPITLTFHIRLPEDLFDDAAGISNCILHRGVAHIRV